jgi:cytochrome P450
VKTFLFAGHDTSSSTMCYIYYLLSLHPESCRKVRQEHDEVLRPSDGTADLLKQSPQLLNEIPFTTAVIKGWFLHHFIVQCPNRR